MRNTSDGRCCNKHRAATHAGNSPNRQSAHACDEDGSECEGVPAMRHGWLRAWLTAQAAIAQSKSLRLRSFFLDDSFFLSSSRRSLPAFILRKQDAALGTACRTARLHAAMGVCPAPQPGPLAAALVHARTHASMRRRHRRLAPCAGCTHCALTRLMVSGSASFGVTYSTARSIMSCTLAKASSRFWLQAHVCAQRRNQERGQMGTRQGLPTT